MTLLVADAGAAPVASPAGAAPADLYGALFAQVQLRRLFTDGKVFADAVPRRPPAEIMAAFADCRIDDDDALRRFVAEHFTLPVAARVHDARRGDDLRSYIRSLWPELVRHSADVASCGSLLPVETPFVVPGGRFTELYYWDSYFTMLGLVRDGHQPLARGMVDAFTRLIERHGHIPNGTRTYYLGRSQPPLFFAMVDLIPDADPGVQRRRLAAMCAEHAFWMRDGDKLAPGESTCRVVAMPDGSILNRYWDGRDTPRDESFAEDVATAMSCTRPEAEVYRALRAGAESGWDFSSRWFVPGGGLSSIATHRIVPVDLNAFLFGLESAIARVAADLCADQMARRFRDAARRRGTSMRRWLWTDDGYFADFDLDAGASRREPTAAILAPLFTGVATREQARRVAHIAATRLLASGGLRTTLIDSGEQWDSPNGWAPLQWIAFRGLRRYGHTALADTIARRWITTVSEEFRASGLVHEKYDVENGGRGRGGEYVPQIGFGWTNGVTAALIDLLEAPALDRQSVVVSTWQ